MRASILIEVPAADDAEGARAMSPVAAAVRHVLVDTSSDLRAQALAFGVRRLDAVLYTHSHAEDRKSVV